MNAGSEAPLKPELVSKAAFLYVSTIGTALLSYIALFFATRFLPEEYSVLALALSVAGVFLFVTDLGLGSAHTKKVSEGADLKSCLSVFLVTRLVLVGIFSAFVISALFLWENVLGQGFDDPGTPLVILIILLYYIQSSITNVFSSTFLATRDVVRAQAIALADVMSRAVATLLVVAFGWGLIGLAWTYAIEGFVALGIALFLAHGKLPRVSLKSINRTLVKQYKDFAMPLAIASILATVILYFDKILISLSSLTNLDTGIYFGSQRLLSFYLMLSPVIASVAYPAFSQMNAKKDNNEAISKMTTGMIRYFLLLTVPLVMFLTLLSQEILAIFLAFDTGALSFSILAIAYSIGLTISPFASQTLGMGMSGAYGRYMIISAIVMIALDVLLIPSSILSIQLMGWGMNGAAVSLLVGQFVLTALFYSNARRHLQLHAPRGIPSIVAAGIVAVIPLYLIKANFSIGRFYDIIGLFILYIGIFAAMAILLRAISFQEIKQILGMLRKKSHLK